MKLCDNNCGDQSGGHTVETWDSKQTGCLAIRVAEEHNEREGNTATLDAAACFALGMELLNHAALNGHKFSVAVTIRGGE